KARRKQGPVKFNLCRIHKTPDELARMERELNERLAQLELRLRIIDDDDDVLLASAAGMHAMQGQHSSKLVPAHTEEIAPKEQTFKDTQNQLYRRQHEDSSSWRSARIQHRALGQDSEKAKWEPASPGKSSGTVSPSPKVPSSSRLRMRSISESSNVHVSVTNENHLESRNCVRGVPVSSQDHQSRTSLKKSPREPTK
ncbi:hypothetical protein BIW11_10571, partial [Tropilaelaps mercedesae]